jgi:hypothetical protein
LTRHLADIFLASHAAQFGRWRKLQERANAKNPADPFIDRAGYLSFLTRWETIDKEWLAEQERRP